MENAVYDLFRECFPQLDMTRDIFFRLIDINKCRIISHSENGDTVGTAVLKDNTVQLVCVRPDFRGRGVGTKLMLNAEKNAADNGFDKIIIGGGGSRLFIGAVTPYEQWKDGRSSFFDRLGYRFSGTYTDMKIMTDGFDLESLNIPKCPSGISFEYIAADRREELIEAVKKVDDDWTKYFTFDSPIFAALAYGKTAGFCIVDENDENILSNGKNTVGSIGCVGVVPEMRRCGIGLEMVGRAAMNLKKRGCEEIFIHYTHLENWYGKLGFETFLRYVFCEKDISAE